MRMRNKRCTSVPDVGVDLHCRAHEDCLPDPAFDCRNVGIARFVPGQDRQMFGPQNKPYLVTDPKRRAGCRQPPPVPSLQDHRSPLMDATVPANMFDVPTKFATNSFAGLS